jgi:PAS domain-containing protein
LQSTSASHVSNDSTTANHASSKSRKLASQANATVNATSVDGEASFSLDNLVPPQPKSEEELAKMTPVERRRCERNLREQQRSYRISQQIKELRDVLNESNIPFKPNKFSILVSVTEYIKQLQSRAIMLDAEHHKLVTTISKSSEAEASSSGAESGVGSASRSPPFADRSSSCSEGSEREAAAGGHGNGFDHHQDLLMVRGIDYGSIFGRCPFALGVASLDGRVLACNEALERLLGCPRLQMIEQSLFLYIRNHQEVFEAMADLLRRSNLGSERGDISSESQGQLLFWCGRIMSQSAQKVGVTVSREPASVEPSSHLLSVCSPLAKLHFTITLTTTPECNPKYFSFSASPVAAS